MEWGSQSLELHKNAWSSKPRIEFKYAPGQIKCFAAIVNRHIISTHKTAYYTPAITLAANEAVSHYIYPGRKICVCCVKMEPGFFFTSSLQHVCNTCSCAGPKKPSQPSRRVKNSLLNCLLLFDDKNLNLIYLLIVWLLVNQDTFKVAASSN